MWIPLHYIQTRSNLSTHHFPTHSWHSPDTVMHFPPNTPYAFSSTPSFFLFYLCRTCFESLSHSCVPSSKPSSSHISSKSPRDSHLLPSLQGFPADSMVKNPPADAGDAGSIPGSRRSLEKEMATHSSILVGESHGQRSLAGYSPWGRKESDTT